MTNAGYNKGLKNASKVERMGWSWAGATKKAVEKRLNAVQAVAEARSELYRLTGKLRKADQGPDKADTVTVLVFAKPDDVGKLAGYELFSTRDPSPDARDLEVMRDHLRDVPIGLVVVLLDREKQNLIVHARPWVLEPPALTLLEEMVAKAEEMKDLLAN